MGKRSREEPCPICLHYHDYEGGEACSVCGHQKKESVLQSSDNSLPYVIVKAFLYLGSFHHAAAIESLRFLEITHMLNLAPQQPAPFEKSFSYHTIHSNPPDLEECFQFIDSVRSQGGKVLVYDMSCRLAAPYIVMAYLAREGEELRSIMSNVRTITALQIRREHYDMLSRLEMNKRGKISLSWEEAQAICSCQPSCLHGEAAICGLNMWNV